jgi:transposase
MLLKSIIRKTLGVKRHRVVGVDFVHGEVFIKLDIRKGWTQPCGTCRAMGRVRDRLQPRTWRHAPLWGMPATLIYSPARISCPRCGKVRVEAIPWSQGKSRLSVGLIWMLSDWCKLLPWQQVARLFGVHWGTVATAVKQAVAYGLAHREMGRVLYIGIDELSRRKGHVYVTNVYDLRQNRLLWSGAGRSRETLQAFFMEHGETLRDQVVGVCCDMWLPYVEMIREHLPRAVLVYDRFHVVQQLLRAVDEVRREEAIELRKSNPDLLKRSRYLWLKNAENLTDAQRARFGYLEKLNLRSHRAWLLKESFREFWEYRVKSKARAFLDRWFWWATHSRLKPIRDFAWTLKRHRDDILNYFDLPINNAAVEGLNNKAKVISHRCYGFRTAAHYIIALYHCLGKLPEPVLVHKFS